MVLGIIKMALCLRGWHVLYDNHWKVLDIFGTLTFSKKLEHRFSLESIKIRNATFPYKTALSELSVKTNRMEHTKWTCHKEWPFLDFCFSIRTSYKELN